MESGYKTEKELPMRVKCLPITQKLRSQSRFGTTNYETLIWVAIAVSTKGIKKAKERSIHN